MKKSSYLLCILHIRHGTKQCELSNKKEATLFLMKTNYLWNILIQECKWGNKFELSEKMTLLIKKC